MFFELLAHLELDSASSHAGRADEGVCLQIEREEEGVAADLDDVRIGCFHGDARDHREVGLVHLSAHRVEAVHHLHAVADRLTHDEGRVYWALVPAAVEEDVMLVEWNGANVANLVRHFDGEHEPLGRGSVEIEHFD